MRDYSDGRTASLGSYVCAGAFLGFLVSGSDVGVGVGCVVGLIWGWWRKRGGRA